MPLFEIVTEPVFTDITLISDYLNTLKLLLEQAGLFDKNRNFKNL